MYIAKSPTGRVGTREHPGDADAEGQSDDEEAHERPYPKGLRTATQLTASRAARRRGSSRDRSRGRRSRRRRSRRSSAPAHALAVGRDGDPFLVRIGERGRLGRGAGSRSGRGDDAQDRRPVPAGVVAVRPQIALSRDRSRATSRRSCPLAIAPTRRERPRRRDPARNRRSSRCSRARRRTGRCRGRDSGWGRRRRSPLRRRSRSRPGTNPGIQAMPSRPMFGGRRRANPSVRFHSWVAVKTSRSPRSRSAARSAG